jgi:transporter family-2 protein
MQNFGGVLGAFFVTPTIIIVPRIGTAAAMAAIIAARLATGSLLDHYGRFAFRTGPLDPKRALGACLLLTGAAPVSRL